jgi:hypothetical protein
MQANLDARDQFLHALSNYSVCIQPYLRTLQERHVASYYLVEKQPFDLDSYCAAERKHAEASAGAFKASIGQGGEQQE